MRTLQQILDEVDRADIFFGTKVDSVFTERLSGETPLHIIAKWGDAEAAQILISNGADINKQGEDGNTPLHYAAMAGQLAAVQCLVKCGAAKLPDRFGNGPRQLAEGHDAVQVFLAQNGF